MSPNLALENHNTIQSKCSTLANSKMFVKRDLKEIVLASPNVLNLSTNEWRLEKIDLD